MKHVKWTDIKGFHNVRSALERYPHMLRGKGTVTYRAKVKLHGTNAGVIVSPTGEVTAMSRTAVITSANDNAGFAKWVEANEARFAAVASDKPIVIFGEWCGPGIQKGVAVNQIKGRIFAVFAARLIDEASENMIVEPGLLEMLVSDVPDAYVIPWLNSGEKFEIDWSETSEAMLPNIDHINACVAEVEECDPWIATRFGVRGIGEGLVFYPVSSEHVGYENFCNLCFKAKGEKHKTVAKSKPTQYDPELAKSFDEFAVLVCTQARLEQGVAETNTTEFVPAELGEFLRWISNDVEKECLDEIEAAGFDLRSAKKACVGYAKNWYFSRTKINDS